MRQQRHTYRCQISSGPEGGSDALHPPEREIPVPPLAAGRPGHAGTVGGSGKTDGAAVAVRVRPRGRGRAAGQCEDERPQKEKQRQASPSPSRRRLHGSLGLSIGFLSLASAAAAAPLCSSSYCCCRINGVRPGLLNSPLSVSLSLCVALRAFPLLVLKCQAGV
jgi:hypothetical protein